MRYPRTCIYTVYTGNKPGESAGDETNTETIIYIKNDPLSDLFTLVTIIFLSVFVLIAIIGKIDAKWLHKNDLFKYSAIIVFGLYAMDFISDVFFTASTFEKDTDIFLCSVTFLLLPLLINTIQLRQAVFDWMKDSENGYVVMEWIDANSKLLYMLTIISGSGFASVRLLNSGLFRRKQFDMGLKKTQMRQFQNKRIWSVVLLENVPQIILQTIFAFKFEGLTSITMMALIFSIFSIILSVLVYSTRTKIDKQQTANESNMKHIAFDVVSNEVSKKGKSLKYQRKKINKKIAEILQIDVVFVEQLRAKPISGGLQLHFRVNMESVNQMSSMENNSDIDSIKKRIQSQIDNGDLAVNISKCWKLKSNLTIKNLIVTDLTECSSPISPISPASDSNTLALPSNAYEKDEVHSKSIGISPVIEKMASEKAESMYMNEEQPMTPTSDANKFLNDDEHEMEGKNNEKVTIMGGTNFI